MHIPVHILRIFDMKSQKLSYVAATSLCWYSIDKFKVLIILTEKKKLSRLKLCAFIKVDWKF